MIVIILTHIHTHTHTHTQVQEEKASDTGRQSDIQSTLMQTQCAYTVGYTVLITSQGSRTVSDKVTYRVH